MNVYSLDKLISETRRLAAEYKKVTGKPLPGVSNEIAEYDAARLLNLELVEDRTDGYDAIGSGSLTGSRVQIKARTIFDELKSGHRIGQLKTEKPWDYVALVIMNDAYEPTEIFLAERAIILKNMDGKQNKRGAMSIAKFKKISQLAWSNIDGYLLGN